MRARARVCVCVCVLFDAFWCILTIPDGNFSSSPLIPRFP